MVNEFSLENIDFKDYDVVRNLIFKRLEVETFARMQPNHVRMTALNSPFDYELYESSVLIYQKLDMYIEICNFKKDNLEILNELRIGKQISEISSKRNLGRVAIFDRIRRMVKKINAIARVKE